MIRIRDRNSRGMLISLFIIAISAFNFISLEGSENVRAVQIATLLVCGMGIGVLLLSFIGWIRSRNLRNKQPLS